MPNFENAFNTVCELVKDFKENEHRYISPQYQEAEVRRDFIDKLFEALGWDVYHRTQKNPYEQEVKVEKGVSVGKAQKRADYAFYIAPEFRQPKFFCEAKKPSRSLKNADDYFQTIRYGWNANTPVAVLTDFEEFHILDCRYKPKPNNVLENPNHKRYTYTDYANAEKFKEIFYLFSRDDVAKNSLEKYSESFPKGKAKGKASFKSTIQAIDEDFLEYIDDIREILAKAFKKNDSNLTSEELTEATQRTIDRIVFIRFLEDKLIEPEYYISEFVKKVNPWTEFISVCRKLDAKYNGIVFKKHFIDEQNFQGPEQTTFKKICDEMSYLNSPYDFNAIPIHILGSIYERFLGKVVNATAQRVKVEEKPEVRKAGGVYYTPKYIVDYIVQNTVGKIIENKTPKQISKLRFADIACGSGSFLIGVFETLLKYHTEYYQTHPEEAKKDGCINKEGQWILSIKQKQNILLNNIYGVDIDNQAVEVTQLSLALKMLEDESTATANEMQVLFHEKILPDLSKNIVCGNSLIGTDIIYEESSDGLFERKRRITPEEERKLNPMDFEKRFPHIFNSSPTSPVIPANAGIQNTNGFDAIVGNPPYRTLLLGKKQESESSTVIDYYSHQYPYSAQYKVNLFALFIERATFLLSTSGLFSYIVPNGFYNALYFKDLREYLLKKGNFIVICDLRYKVFEDAEIGGNAVFIYSKNLNTNIQTLLINSNTKQSFDNPKYEKYGSREFLKNINYNLSFTKGYQEIYNNINSLNISSLGKITKIYQGIITGDNKKYISTTQINSKWKKILKGRDINRYIIIYDNNYVYYSPKDLWSNTDINMFAVESKIISRQTSDRLIASLDTEGYFTLDSTHVIHLLNESISIKYILGLYNSTLLNYLYQNTVKELGRVFAQVKVVNLKPLPIRMINFQNQSEKQSHDLIVSLVNEMLEAKKQLHNAKTDRDKTYYENKCEDLDRAIDSEVYKLYGLTEDEIKIIEGIA